MTTKLYIFIWNIHVTSGKKGRPQIPLKYFCESKHPVRANYSRHESLCEHGTQKENLCV